MNLNQSESWPAKAAVATEWRVLFIELFVALSLSVTYYFLIGNYAVGSENNTTNRWVFTSCSIPAYHLQALDDVWKGRLSGLLLSGWFFDFLVKDNSFNAAQYDHLFALYQSTWLFLLFLTMICALRYSLFINLGIFAGLIYNFTPASGLYFYPWDIPATLFFTLAVLFFSQRRMYLMAIATCTGCFFKETVLVCAVLALFAGHWKWTKRILFFAGMVAVYVLGKKFLLEFLNLNVAVFSMNNATNWSGLLKLTILTENLRRLFSPILNHAIFANAGTLAVALILGWRRRYLPYMAVILVFLAGQFMYGGFAEFRIFMQILPLCLILLSERWYEYVGPGKAGGLTDETGTTWAMRQSFPALIPLTIILIGLSTGIVAWRYYNIFKDLQPDSRLGSELGQHDVKPEGDANDVVTRNYSLRQGYARAELKLGMISTDNHQFSDAINHYQRVLELDTNSVPALNNLAWLRATAPDPNLRNGDEALRLAERACQITKYKEAFLIGTLAAAYAELGRFTNAVTASEQACAAALAQGQKEVADANTQMLELYKSGRPYHQEAQTPR